MEFKYNNPKIINIVLTTIVVALLILIIYKSKQPHKVKVGQVWVSMFEVDCYQSGIFI